MRRDRPLTATASQPIRRTLDPATINRAASHPDVRPWLGELQMGALDFAPLVANAANVTMANEHGGFIGHRIGEGLYEVHSVFAPEGRGRLKAETARGQAFLFMATDCVRIVTKVPACNPRAAALARQAGFVEVFSRPDAWDAPDGTRCAVSYQELTLEGWVGACRDLPAEGAALAALVGLNVRDDFTLRTLGALSLMLKGGCAEKAAWLYGSRAAFGGLPPLSFLAVRPPVVVINGAALQAVNGQLESL